MSTLNAKRGDDFQVSFQWLDEDDVVVNMTGMTVEFTTNINRDKVVYTSSPVVTVTPLTGTVEINIDDSVTEDWAGDGTWKLKVTAPMKLTLGDGNLEVD